MVYWMALHLTSNNQGILNAAENVGILKADSRLWQTEEYKCHRGIDPDGNNFLYVSMFFNTLMDWGLHFNKLSMNGILNSAMKDSYIKMTECWHDEKLKGICIKSDKLIYEVIV